MTPPPRSDAGTAAVELVLVAPVFLAALLLVVGFGRIVEAQGRVQGAARDAARAASLARTSTLAEAAARDAANLNLTDRGVSCRSFDVAVDAADFRPGGQVRVSVACTATLAGFGLSGLPGSKTLHGQATAPLEQYRGVR